MQPFLKWAGGKRWLFDSEQFEIPEFDGLYREPFIGGGAAFFQLMPDKGVISDANTRLIELYQTIQDDWQKLESFLSEHADRHCKVHYYQVRSAIEVDRFKRAAQFLYLNRTCFNGLYRENKKGLFNVPIGSKQNVIVASDDFEGWASALVGIIIHSCDFEDAIDAANSGDFLFIDPPYTVKHNMNGFVKYNQKIFAWDDQIRLKNALERAVSRGVQVALTNADHNSIKELYSEFGTHRILRRSSVIAGGAKHRSLITELLITA